MRRKLILGGVILFGFLIGVGIGASGKKTTVTKKETTTIMSTVEHTVTTTTTQEAKTTTQEAKTTTVKATPAACTAAISDARQFALLMMQVTTDVTPLFNLVGQAATAGASGDTAKIYSIAAQIKTMNSQLTGLTTRIANVVATFNADSAGCH